MPTRLTIRFDFDGERRLGPGKIALLEAIAGTGSISAAGRAHELSHRRVWLLVEELNHLFGQPLVTARPGGVKGGGAALTPAGERVVALYREAEAKMRLSAVLEIAHLESALAGAEGIGKILDRLVTQHSYQTETRASPPCRCSDSE
jgi:molybdate transport system regulatory protein